MEEQKEKKIYIYNYFIILFVSFLSLIILLLIEKYKFIPFVMMSVGTYTIIKIYVQDKLLMTPISIFSLIWLILIPICSFEYPLMREMNSFEWKIILEFIICFSIGAIVAGNIHKIKIHEKRKLKSKVKIFNWCVLILSVFALIALYINFGGIPILENDANVGKDNFRSSSVISKVLSLVSYFGAAAIIVFCLEDFSIIKSKIVFFPTIIYIVLLIFSGERFFVTILIVLCLLSFCKCFINKEFFKKILLCIFLILFIFIFILQFRGNAEQKQKYFIDTGIYEGSVQSLVNTEIFRYLGMQTRLLTKTFEIVEPGMTKGTLTFAPILKLFGIEAGEISSVRMYGYTAKTIITKVYADFGNLWTIIIIILSFNVNVAYICFSKKNSIFSQYLAIVWLMFLLFSFYAYFDNLIIYFLHFIVYIIFIEMINKVKM